MVAGAGTGVGGTAQPPGILESQGTAAEDVTKKNVGMVREGSDQIVPFTLQTYDEIFKYKSEPDRPTLHPLLHLRHATVPKQVEEDASQPIYDNLVKNLPKNLKNGLLGEMAKPFNKRDPGAVALSQLLAITAKWIVLLTAVTKPAEANSVEEARNQANGALPFFMLNGVLYSAKDVLDNTENFLSQIGPNHPSFDLFTNLLAEMKPIVTELNTLKEEIAKGNISQNIQYRFIALASNLDRIFSQIFQRGSGKEFQILGSTIDSLAVVASAWALTSASPSLSIALSAAMRDVTTAQGFDAILDAILDGLLDALETGPKAELDEMNDLYNMLVGLRDHVEGGG